MVRSHSHDGGFNCRRQVLSEPPRASPCFERARICGGQQGPSHRSHGPELSAHALRQDACALPRQTVPRGAEGLGRATPKRTCRVSSLRLVLDAAFAREFLGYRKTVFAAPFILYLWAAVLRDTIGLPARSGHSVSKL